MADTHVDKLKSHSSKDALTNYAADHSIRLTDVQRRLNVFTLNEVEEGYQLGAPETLQMNANLIRAIGAKKVLDVGVFTGASALSAALALPPDGQVHALDFSEEYVNMGKSYWEEAGVSQKIHLHIAPAAQTLQKFIDQGQMGSFDFAFLDVCKTDYDECYEKCLVLVRSGGIIAVDNTLWNGQVLDPTDQTSDTVAIRQLNKKLKDDQRIHLSFLMVGDGLSLCFKI